ncbi:MAG TPA: hypothetical protein VHJ19_09805, partial [Gammaproteobacteria bacterium]|nr:hypothetical protein [Gammaproteobacteria bacterium]
LTDWKIASTIDCGLPDASLRQRSEALSVRRLEVLPDHAGFGMKGVDPIGWRIRHSAQAATDCP